MYAATDSAGIDTGPVDEDGRWSTIYFLLYMFLVAIFLLNLFVGFVIVTFQAVSVKQRKEYSLDRNQVHLLQCTIYVFV